MKAKLLCLILGLQAVWVLGMVGLHEHRLRADPTVWLETQPMDPRDLLRGDYVRLNYMIGRIPQALFAKTGSSVPKYGETVYVVLEKKGEFYQAVAAASERPASAPGQFIVCGRAMRSWSPPRSEATVRIDYGIERYYVPEGKGNLRGKLTVEAVVPASGRLLIKQVQVDGRAFGEAPR